MTVLTDKRATQQPAPATGPLEGAAAPARYAQHDTIRRAGESTGHDVGREP